MGSVWDGIEMEKGSKNVVVNAIKGFKLTEGVAVLVMTSQQYRL
jgi:hypothetical protein